jgi:hypothetical protein
MLPVEMIIGAIYGDIVSRTQLQNLQGFDLAR